MMDAYKTINQTYETMIIEKKSKFICQVIPITSEEDAKIHLEALKKEHHNARHHCLAYRLGTEQIVERYSDDGEPSGTAGMPMLEVLRGEGLCNVMAVVIRYFGGTLLGTGGLARAYTESIQVAIKAAKIIEKQLTIKLSVGIGYTFSGKIDYIIHHNHLNLENTIYDEQVTYIIYLSLTDQERILGEITDATSGMCHVEELGLHYIYQEGRVIMAEAIS
jgi:uncharacterized YigZ family protein